MSLLKKKKKKRGPINQTKSNYKLITVKSKITTINKCFKTCNVNFVKPSWSCEETQRQGRTYKKKKRFLQ